MYLTQFEFNVQRRESRHILASAERIHASILHSFPHGATDGGRVLWRLDKGDHGRCELWISSPAPPDLTGLVESCGWPTTDSWRTADLDGFLGRLAPNQQWRFRLAANPVKVLPANGSRGKPIPLTISGHVPWLLDRCASFGFSVGKAQQPTVQVTRCETLRFTKTGGMKVSLRISQFDGILRVTDAHALRSAIVGGIGRAKAYGAGLLTLAPLP